MNGKNILIVEDDEAISNLIKINLNMVGYESQQVFDGLEAFNLLKKEAFDLILMDIMLPGMDGFELMKRMRNLLKFISYQDNLFPFMVPDLLH